VAPQRCVWPVDHAGDPADLRRLDYETVLETKARRDRLDAAIEGMAADSEFIPLVRRLGCLRGVSTLTGFALAVEIADWHRFTGNSIVSSVGLIPAESSSGSSPLGPIAKTGNGQAQRLMVEAAWQHRPATPSARRCGTAGTLLPPPPAFGAMKGTGGCTSAG
jgi:transposase